MRALHEDETQSSCNECIVHIVQKTRWTLLHSTESVECKHTWPATYSDGYQTCMMEVEIRHTGSIFLPLLLILQSHTPYW